MFINDQNELHSLGYALKNLVALALPSFTLH